MLSLVDIGLFFVGIVSGFIAGLLGIGGAIILIPVLIYIPPFFGTVFSFHHITGLSMSLVFFIALTVTVTHFREGNLNLYLILIVGSSMILGSLIGSVGSKFIPEKVLVGIFVFILVFSIIMLLFPANKNSNRSTPTNEPSVKTKKYITTSREIIMSISLGSIIGVISGMVGAGAAPMLIPALKYFFK